MMVLPSTREKADMLTPRQAQLLSRFRMFGSLSMYGKQWEDVKTLAKLGYVKAENRFVYVYVRSDMR